MGETTLLGLGFILRKRSGVSVSVLGRIGVLWREQRNKSIDVRRPEICQADSLKIEDLEKCFLILEQIRKIVLSF